MSTSLSSRVNNLSEIYKKECKGCQERMKIKLVCNFIGLKDNKLHYKCKDCKKGQLKPINGLIKNFPNIYQLCNGEINKFVWFSRKGVYSYEHMDIWKRFYETAFLNKESSFSELYLEDITDKDYTHAQKCLKNLD